MMSVEVYLRGFAPSSRLLFLLWGNQDALNRGCSARSNRLIDHHGVRSQQPRERLWVGSTSRLHPLINDVTVGQRG